MSEYDFLVLSSDEFELFCKDILEIELGIKLENFKTGKDGGIDLRHAPSDDDVLIVQCKRYKDYASLISTLKKEVAKVKKLNPDRYILTTSVPLNPNEKDSIKKLFEGFIKSTGDIYGKDELQTILKNHHSIERKHYKLWLASTNVLSTILHSDVFNRSKFTEEQIKEKVSLYVLNESFDIALKHLEKNKVIVLSGGPGVGKTTLADMLYLEYSAQGYEFIEISDDINEGEQLYNPEMKQVFYYDDFLGRNFLNDKLSKNEDRRIINFITKIMKSKDKIFIMTTREYILNQARINYEVLDDQKIDINKFILNVENYTINVRAKILYNHLYFSNLPEEFIEIIVKERTYKKIIEHSNYSPRLISRMTSELNYNDIVIKDYPEMFIREMDYPYHTWGHIFENQINNYSRWILKLLMIMGDRGVLLTNLENNFNALNLYLGRPFESIALKQGIKELEKSFIRIDEELLFGTELIRFLNPSIVDFLIQYNSDNRSDIITLWESTKFFHPMFEIFSFSNVQGKLLIPKDLKKEYIDMMIKRLDEFEDCQSVSGKIKAINKLDKFVDFGVGIAKEVLIKAYDDYSVHNSRAFVDLLIKYKDILTQELDIMETLTILIDYTGDYDEVVNLIKLYDFYQEELKEVFGEVDKQRVLENLVDDINSNLEDHYDFEEVVDVVEKFGEIFDVSVVMEVSVICELYDEILQASESEPDYDYEHQRAYNKNLSNEDDYVDDLFESLIYE
ncbi:MULTISPECIES: nSTAND3 domain-containing NTPase [Lysinibacillus]|uniref:nSTAND3 domain-containing NTPase n=1 Tax=Lysinibacillus TaxID=400634 RepID=UPI00068AF8F6|nr:restriction endonuclease [Lysinibacillus sphaericus]